MATPTIFAAEKFQIKEQESEDLWSNIADYRFKTNDIISMYRLQQSDTGYLAWDWSE